MHTDDTTVIELLACKTYAKTESNWQVSGLPIHLAATAGKPLVYDTFPCVLVCTS